MRRAGLKLGVLALSGAAAAVAASSEDAPLALKICTLLPLRLLRDSFTAATIAFGWFVYIIYLSVYLLYH
jgi:aarF domain-containing kinase